MLYEINLIIDLRVLLNSLILLSVSSISLLLQAEVVQLELTICVDNYLGYFYVGVLPGILLFNKFIYLLDIVPILYLNEQRKVHYQKSRRATDSGRAMEKYLLFLVIDQVI